MLTLAELAQQVGVCRGTIKNWNQAGLLRSHLYNDRNDCLFEPMGDEAPVKGKHKGVMASLRQMRHSRKVSSEKHKEVQYEV